MSKKIIFCADGTWDAPQSSTNVYTLFKAIQTTSDQVPYYDDGVGSDGTPLQQLAGGAIGEGIFQKSLMATRRLPMCMTRATKFSSLVSAGALTRPAVWPA